MPAEVFFRGPILYLSRGAEAVGALVPNSDRVIVSDAGDPNCHPDGTEAKRHFAGFAIFEGDNLETEVVRLDISRKIISLHDGDGPCATDDEFRKVIPVDEAANEGMGRPMTLISPTESDFWTRVAARVELHGGTLTGALTSNAKFKIDSPTGRFSALGQTPVSAEWRGAKDDATIIITDPDGSNFMRIRLDKGQKGFIYNWDSRDPKAENATDALAVLPECADGVEDIEDTDFKWVYQLFNPPAVNFTTWLRGAPLRAPVTRCRDVTAAGTNTSSPGSSNCFSSRASLA